MTPLFSDAGYARLGAIVQPGVLCVFDFDGTLAPIVSQPEQAVLSVPVLSRLLALQRVARIGILTGRALADIAPRLQFTPDFMVGNHGLEGLPDSPQQIGQFQQLCSAWRHDLEQAFSNASDCALSDPGIVLEDKLISLSVHYRHAEQQVPVADALRALFATLAPAPRIIGGKYVFNLLPTAAGDKGTAFEQLMLHSGAPGALYVGDDVTDEDVFQLQREDLLSIRIGQSLDSSAQFFLRRHVDIVQLLDELIARLSDVTGAGSPPSAQVADAGSRYHASQVGKKDA